VHRFNKKKNKKSYSFQIIYKKEIINKKENCCMLREILMMLQKERFMRDLVSRIKIDLAVAVLRVLAYFF
jgi:hypothetical protein